MDIKFWLGYASEWLGAIAVTMIAGVSPLLKKVRQIEYRFPQREATFALSLFALIYLIAFQYFSNPAFDFAKKAAAVFAGGDLAEHMLLAVVCLVPFILALLLRGQPLKSIGWGKENLKSGATLGLLLALVTLFLRGKFTALLGGVSSEAGKSAPGLADLCGGGRNHLPRIYPIPPGFSAWLKLGMAGNCRVIPPLAIARQAMGDPFCRFLVYPGDCRSARIVAGMDHAQERACHRANPFPCGCRLVVIDLVD